MIALPSSLRFLSTKCISCEMEVGKKEVRQEDRLVCLVGRVLSRLIHVLMNHRGSKVKNTDS